MAWQSMPDRARSIQYLVLQSRCSLDKYFWVGEASILI